MTKHFVMAHRSSASQFGGASAPCKDADGNVKLFDTEYEALQYIETRMANRFSDNIWYTYGGTKEI